jgi:hypothetical protein
MGANAVTTVYDFTAGQVLTAAQMDNVNCGVPVFATTVTRDAAFGGTGEKTLAEGQACYIEGTGLQVYDGSAWITFGSGKYQDWTPTVSGITTGNGTTVARYIRIGKFITGYYRFTLGSTSAVTGRIIFTLPVTPITGDYRIGMTAFAVDTGVAGYTLAADTAGADLYMNAVTTSGTYAAWAPTSATVPITWGNGDYISIQFFYEAA